VRIAFISLSSLKDSRNLEDGTEEEDPAYARVRFIMDTTKLNITNFIRLLISAPQRSPAIPNKDGTHALFTVSTYSIESNKETKEVKILDLHDKDKDNAITIFSDDKAIEEPQWLIGSQILWKKVKDGGCTELWAAEAVAGDKK
jgi:hypothetical protein